MANIAAGDDGLSSFTDKKDFNVFLGIDPFSQTKNTWLRGMRFKGAAWFCNVDDRAAQNGCSRYRIRDNSRAARQTLFDTGSNSIGEGLHLYPVSAGRSALTGCARWVLSSLARTAPAPLGARRPWKKTRQ
jgi:hypothetical protein